MISNPLVIQGVSFSDPYALESGFCSSPSCTSDPGNADGGNIVLVMNPGGTIELPDRTRVVRLDVQGIGDNPFQLRVTDRAGTTESIDEVGTSFGRTTVTLQSPVGIRRIEVAQVGGTGGPLVLAAVAIRS